MNTRAFLDSINDKHVTLSIIGLGYVGLPLALNFSDSGFSVLGFDADKKKVEQLIKYKSKHIGRAVHFISLFGAFVVEFTCSPERVPWAASLSRQLTWLAKARGPHHFRRT